MKTSPRTPKRTLLSALLCASLVMPAAPLKAQWVVSDPTNLIQNTTSAVSEVTSAYQQIQSVVMQTKQLANQIQNMKNLEIDNLQDLKQALNAIQQVVARGKFIAQRWGRVAANLVEVWGKYGPPDYDGENFWRRRKAWEDATDDAMAANVETQAAVGSSHEGLHNQAIELEAQSRHVKGEVAATELQTKLTGVQVSQEALALQLQISESEARQAKELELRRKDEAARQRALERLGRGFDQQPVAEPVELPDLY